MSTKKHGTQEKVRNNKSEVRPKSNQEKETDRESRIQPQGLSSAQLWSQASLGSNSTF